jgi:hypothetical protein
MHRALWMTPMRRVQAFEFEDQPWLPDRLRRYLTDIVHAGHHAFRFHEVWLPLLARLVRETGQAHLVDLCSGSGGPVSAIVERLRQQHGLRVTATLTDRFPHRSAIARINGRGGLDGVRYLEHSVDATAVPEELSGIRTMFAGFHHLPQHAARGVLADAFARRQPLCIFELTRNAPHALLCFLLALPAVTWALTPTARPLDGWRLLLTYAVPLVPALVTWDGLASHLRTYSPAELRAMVADLRADDYRWEAGYLRRAPIPYRFPYLLGTPLQKGV